MYNCLLLFQCANKMKVGFVAQACKSAKPIKADTKHEAGSAIPGSISTSSSPSTVTVGHQKDGITLSVDLATLEVGRHA